jgi:uncharacterized membrane protein YuzA (DUF378 family)
MTTLGGILGLMLLAVLLGKNTKQIRLESYVLVGLLVLLEVFLMVVKMYTLSEPSL